MPLDVSALKIGWLETSCVSVYRTAGQVGRALTRPPSLAFDQAKMSRFPARAVQRSMSGRQTLFVRVGNEGLPRYCLYSKTLLHLCRPVTRQSPHDLLVFPLC